MHIYQQMHYSSQCTLLGVSWGYTAEQDSKQYLSVPNWFSSYLKRTSHPLWQCLLLTEADLSNRYVRHLYLIFLSALLQYTMLLHFAVAQYPLAPYVYCILYAVLLYIKHMACALMCRKTRTLQLLLWRGHAATAFVAATFHAVWTYPEISSIALFKTIVLFGSQH